MSTNLRLDKWLWHARFYKTRTLAAKQIRSKKISVNEVKVYKPGFQLKVGDVLSFVKADAPRVIEVKGESKARHSAELAAALFDDRSPEPVAVDPLDPKTAEVPSRERGMGRPTKADRRAYNKLTSEE